jgi:hypothetical protein
VIEEGYRFIVAEASTRRVDRLRVEPSVVARSQPDGEA